MSYRYLLYTDESHAHLIPLYSRMSEVVIRPTYEEASAVAYVRAMEGIDPKTVTVLHKPHNPTSVDPMDSIGSWGWKD